ncbi:MAG: endonuclease/exonuclease/phosphatase family protein [Candidatus Hodarchaeota archaeon]
MTIPTGVNPRVIESMIFAIFFPSGIITMYINLLLLGTAALLYLLIAGQYRLFLGGDTRTRKDIYLEILYMLITGFLVSPVAGFFSMHLFIKSLSYVKELADKYKNHAVGGNPITKRRVVAFVSTVIFWTFAYVSMLIVPIVFALMLEQEIYPFHLFPGVIVGALVNLIKKAKNLPCYNSKPRFSDRGKVIIKVIGLSFPVVFGTLFITTGFIKIHDIDYGPPASGGTLRIMTYNIRNGNMIEANSADDWVNRGPLLAGYVDSISPDILCVQEAQLSQLEYLKQQLASRNYEYTGFGRLDGIHGDEHTAIFFDNDEFTFIDGDTFWLSAFPDIPSSTWLNIFIRICTWVVLKNNTDQTQFCVFNTHLDFIEPFFSNAAKLIKNRIVQHSGDLPVFLTGDFNLHNDTDAFNLLREYSDKKLVDSYTGPVRASSCFNFVVDPSDTSDRIDFILVSPGITVNTIDIPHDTRPNGRTYSDHYPVILNCTM